jgi:hypothetical protein
MPSPLPPHEAAAPICNAYPPYQATNGGGAVIHCTLPKGHADQWHEWRPNPSYTHRWRTYDKAPSNPLPPDGGDRGGSRG